MSNANKMQIETDFVFKDKNFLKELNKITKKLKEIKSIVKHINVENINAKAKLTQNIVKNEVIQQKIKTVNEVAKTNTEKSTETPAKKKNQTHTQSLAGMSKIIKDMGSSSLDKVFEPLGKILEIKDKISKVIEKAKELKTALKDATHTDGKFDFGKAFKFGAITAGLLIVSALYQQFTDHLSKNEEAQKKWNDIINTGKEILTLIVQIIIEFISALFGFTKSADASKNKSEMFNKILDKTKEIIEKLKEKIEQLREWIDRNRETINSWGERLKSTIPVIIAFFVIFKLVKFLKLLTSGIGMVNAAFYVLGGNPVVAIIVAIIAAVILLAVYFKYLYDTNEEFRAAIDRAWNAIKEVFSSVWEKICSFFQGFIDFFVRLWTENEGLRTTLETVWMALCDLFDTVSNTIGTIFSVIINTIIDFFTQNETCRQVIEFVWNFIKDHIISIVSFLLGGGIGLLIGIIVEFLTKNEEAREVIAKVWTGIKEAIKVSIDGIIDFIDELTYRIQEVGKAWEALKNGNFAEAKKHALNAITGEGSAAFKEALAKDRELEKSKKEITKNIQQINENIQKSIQKNIDKATPSQKGTLLNSGKGINTISIADSVKTDEKVRSSVETIETKKQEISQEWLDNWYKFIDSQATTISNLLTQWGTFFTNLQTILTLAITLMTISWSLYFITFTMMLTTMSITATSIIENLKVKFGELSSSLIPFINKLAEAGEKLNFLKYNSNLGISINSYSVACACNMQRQATGTNHFSGGLTSINERGDELLIAPNGTVIANNPSTTNIMRDLLLVKTNLSHINFKMNANRNESPKNNITVNIGNISNRNDIDYMVNQLSMLDLS